MIFFKIKNCLFIVLLISFQSCLLDDKEKDVITEVLDEFKIEMIESLGNERHLNFEFESIEMQPCLNSSIDRTVIVNSEKVSILVDGIVPASDCNPGSAPATAKGNAGVLANRRYDFDVTLRGTVFNEGDLIVDDEKYEIRMVSTDGIVIENSVLYKIPENSIWGYVAYDDETLVGEKPAEFLEELLALVQPHALANKYYGHFRVLENEEIELKKMPTFNHITTFCYQFTGEKTYLIDLLEQYRSEPGGEQMELTIFTSDGDRL
jgi:hypothetical protein